jgi:hypothetical protein
MIDKVEIYCPLGMVQLRAVAGPVASELNIRWVWPMAGRGVE